MCFLHSVLDFGYTDDDTVPSTDTVVSSYTVLIFLDSTVSGRYCIVSEVFVNNFHCGLRCFTFVSLERGKRRGREGTLPVMVEVIIR
jgi:hypothetical protein